MDSGCVPPDDTFEPDFDVCAGRKATEIIWITDQLLCLEIAWLEGYPLSQTVFTSLHLDRLLSHDNTWPYTFDYGRDEAPRENLPEILVHDVLRAYCIGVAKCVQLVLNLVQSQHFYEEEDFVTHLFGRELLPKLGSNEAGQLLDQILEFVTASDLPDDIREALEQRVLFRRAYLAALADDATAWPTLLPMLNVINGTHGLGKPITDAFSDKVQRQLATSTPPRPMLQISWDNACKKWRKVIEDLIEADTLTASYICVRPYCLQRAVWAFASRVPQPGTFPRAYMQNILFGGDRLTEDLSQFDLMLWDIRALMLAGDSIADPDSFQVEVTSDPRHMISRHVEAFMDKAFDEYLNLYRMVCQNRCRIRRLFSQAIPILDGMEAEAYSTDKELNKITNNKVGVDGPLNPLSSWVKFHKLRVMAWTVQLGFETDIYLPDELSPMHWLLTDFLQKQMALLDHVEPFLLQRSEALVEGHNVRHSEELMTALAWLHSLRVSAKLQHSLALALYRLCGLLLAVECVQAPKRDYAQEKLLYDVRMKPYMSVSRELILSPQAFREAEKAVGTVESACKIIHADVKDAKSGLAELKKVTPQQGNYLSTEGEWTKEIRQLETTCVAVAVQTSQLERIAEKHGKKEEGSLKGLVEVSIPPPGKRYHEWWVVPMVKEKKSP
jgi:N-alpha-acetyltransferase 35, NatC auxiliary subunit